jgi:hydrogenase maturation protease
MTGGEGDLLVIGIGNVLLRDDGAGVRAVEVAGRVQADRPDAFPPGTQVVDGGTLGLELLPMVEDARAVVMIDAVDLRGSPGDVAVLRGDALQGTLYQHVSPHQVGVGDLLAAGRLTGRLPDQIALVGIQPGEIQVGLDLSEAVQAAIPRAAAVAEAVAWELERALHAGDVPATTIADHDGDAPAVGAD